jgi:hypothetical protein
LHWAMSWVLHWAHLALHRWRQTRELGESCWASRWASLTEHHWVEPLGCRLECRTLGEALWALLGTGGELR